MSEFVTVKDTWLSGRVPSSDEVEMAGFDLGQILGNIGTQFVNNLVPGLGPVINPGFYKDQQQAQQAAQQQQQATTAQQQRVQQITQPGYAGGIAPTAAAKPGLPSWVIPASIAGGAVVIALILAIALGGRSRNPVRYKSARDLARAFGTSGYYSDEGGLVGVRGKGGVIWFRWDPIRRSYRMAGTTRGAEGADYRRVA